MSMSRNRRLVVAAATVFAGATIGPLMGMPTASAENGCDDTVSVPCAPPELDASTICDANGSTIELALANPNNAPQTFDIKVNGVTEQDDFLVAPMDSEQVTITGSWPPPEVLLEVFDSTGAELILDLVVAVPEGCAEETPDPEWSVADRCSVDGDTIVTVSLTNPFDQDGTVDLVVNGELTEDDVVVPAGGTKEFEIAAEPGTEVHIQIFDSIDGGDLVDTVHTAAPNCSPAPIPSPVPEVSYAG